ncbi:MAG TPA: hypothetical protein VK071_10655 [Tissierellales bacterium]|nr:hypothetical protein [Tissierellales bacterium]
MNTSGVIRGYMSKNMDAEEFIKIVVSALSREFGEKVQLQNINDDEFIITMADYTVTMSKELINELKSPYGVDRFILEKFESQGFQFDRNRSQYIQYCFGNYTGIKKEN